MASLTCLSVRFLLSNVFENITPVLLLCVHPTSPRTSRFRTNLSYPLLAKILKLRPLYIGVMRVVTSLCVPVPTVFAIRAPRL